MRLNFGGIRGRLHALAALNAVALAIVGAIVFLGLGRIETLTRGMARDELSRVVANAGLERALAGLNSRIALLSRTCRDATGDTDWPAFLAAFEEIAQRDVDRSVAPEIARLAPVAFALMETCQRIRGTLVRLRSLDEMLFADLGALDSITARAIIEYTLARRDMSHLDQIMLLISGCRASSPRRPRWPAPAAGSSRRRGSCACRPTSCSSRWPPSTPHCPARWPRATASCR
jgi:hypothetical protein